MGGSLELGRESWVARVSGLNELRQGLRIINNVARLCDEWMKS